MSKNTLSSLARGLAVAEYIADRSRATLAETALWAGVSKATAFRILTTLEERQWVTRDPMQAGYRAGPVLDGMRRTDTRETVAIIAEPILNKLWGLTGETVNFAFLLGGILVYDRVLDGRQALRINVEAGAEAPFHASGLGKAVLAAMPNDRARGILGPGPLQAMTPLSKLSPEVVMAELTQVRELGYALDLGEALEGCVCIAAVVLGPDQQPVGALSVCGPDLRLNASTIPEVASLVVKAAESISQGLRRSATVPAPLAAGLGLRQWA